MKLILSIWTWLDIALVSIFGCIVQAVVWLVCLPFDRRSLVAGRLYRINAIIATKLTPFWKFGIYGDVPRNGINPLTVVVSNHASTADPFLISYLPWEMKWLGKSSLFKIPFVGWSMWLSWDIPVLRGHSESAKRAMAECKKRLDAGVPVMIFPEGTRSKTLDLLPFKDGAFRLAIENGADVLPVAIAGTRRALPKNSFIFGYSRAWVTVGKPISTKGMTLDDIESLKARARAEIEAMRAVILPLSSDAPREGEMKAAA